MTLNSKFIEARNMSLPRKNMLISMFDSIAENVDLTETQLENIQSAYKGVGKYLASCDHPLLREAQIYPQGSIRLKTAVKPLQTDEYDVDLILFLPNAINADRQNIVSVVKEHLLKHGTYRHLIEDLPRGFRINYKGNYHLDITPSKSYDFSDLKGHPLWVVDKKQGFKESNPEGMALLFDDACKKIPKRVIRTDFVEALSGKSVEDFPEQGFKKPLNRIVQILKRHRDIWASESSNSFADFKPISVVITTLCSKAYIEVATSQKVYTNDFDILLDVLELMPHHIEVLNGEVLIANPSMRMENYAEKWNRLAKNEGENYRNAFGAWHSAAVESISKFADSQAEGLDVVFNSFNNFFGNTAVEAAKGNLIESLNLNRSKDSLGISLSSGAVVLQESKRRKKSQNVIPADVTVLKRNRFYGSD